MDLSFMENMKEGTHEGGHEEWIQEAACITGPEANTWSAYFLLLLMR
jgi:hypothetical protein